MTYSTLNKASLTKLRMYLDKRAKETQKELNDLDIDLLLASD
jgi:hypothetical protein